MGIRHGHGHEQSTFLLSPWRWAGWRGGRSFCHRSLAQPAPTAPGGNLKTQGFWRGWGRRKPRASTSFLGSEPWARFACEGLSSLPQQPPLLAPSRLRRCASWLKAVGRAQTWAPLLAGGPCAGGPPPCVELPLAACPSSGRCADLSRCSEGSIIIAVRRVVDE